MKQEVEKVKYDSRALVDENGINITCSIEDLGVCFGYDLPSDKFRQPYMARRVRVNFKAEAIPPLGYKTFALVYKQASFSEKTNSSLITGERKMGNERIMVKINDDGRLNITDKVSNYTYEGLCYYEDVGDIGNEYIFRQPHDDRAITTKGNKAKIKLVEDEAFRAVFEIINTIEIPESADELLIEEINSIVKFRDRNAQRSNTKKEISIITYVCLEEGSSSVKVKTKFNNQFKDHRLRVLFPTNVETETHLVDSIFEVAKRNNKPSAA